MKNKKFFSFYRCVLFLSFVCLSVPILCIFLREGPPPASDSLALGLLTACSVLLLLPVVEETPVLSLFFSLAEGSFCLAGALTVLRVRLCLSCVLTLQLAYLCCRIREQFAQPRTLFRPFYVWVGVEQFSRLVWSLVLFLAGACFPGPEAPAAYRFLYPGLAAVLFVLLLVRVRTGRTLLLGGKKELRIKEMVRSSLQTVSPQVADPAEDMSRMRRLYDRVVELMEQKQPFLDDEFGLDDLAGAVFSNRTYLSKTINQMSGRNFNQFVNYYRVRYSLTLLDNDPSLRVSTVAMMSGFHTRVTFNMAFKLNTGKTPTEYLQGKEAEKLAG
ncbi:MAG: AraC family transcriptional regulator [Bacteroidales bacterium]|nr:AraC family transcriptional regulator [Bacteroidales bacterium]